MDIKSTPTTKREERERQDLLCARARASYDRTARTSRVDKAGQSLRRFLAQQVKSCVCCKCVRRRAQIAFDAHDALPRYAKVAGKGVEPVRRGPKGV